MDDPPENRPPLLEYARRASELKPSPIWKAVSAIFLTMGIPLVGLALPVLVLDIYQRFYEPDPFVLLGVGTVFCCLGMYFKTYYQPRKPRSK